MNPVTANLPAFIYKDETIKNLVSQLANSPASLMSEELPESGLSQKNIKAILDIFIRSAFLKLDKTDSMPLLDDAIKSLIQLADPENLKKSAAYEKKLDSILRNIVQILFTTTTNKALPKPIVTYAQNEILKNSEVSTMLGKAPYDTDESDTLRKKQKTQDLFSVAEQSGYKDNDKNQKSKNDKNPQNKKYQSILNNMKESLQKILRTLEEYKKEKGAKALTAIPDIDERINYIVKMIKEIELLLLQIRLT